MWRTGHDLGDHCRRCATIRRQPQARKERRKREVAAGGRTRCASFSDTEALAACIRIRAIALATRLSVHCRLPVVHGPIRSMDAKTFDKSKLPSRHVTEGPTRAPHRSYYYAMGLEEEHIHRPFVGVVSCWNEAAPCNISLMRQAQSAKMGVDEAGGTPREFCTITVTDGIAMGHQGMKSSLVSREVIADSIELTMRGHCYDAIVGIAGCDKSLPGIMMAMLRLNVPSVFLYGGSILPGKFKGRDVTVVDVFEGVGMHSAGRMSDEELHELECVACPSAGSCGGQFTANTMACVSEAIGLALPGSAGAPAPFESRDAYARRERQGGDEPAGARHPSARHLHARSLRERRRHRRRHRRLDQRGAASAGHGARGRHRLRPVRRRRDLQAHAVHRRPQAGRQVRRQGRVRHRRRAADPEGAARRRAAARRLPDRHRPHAEAEPREGEVQHRPEGRLSGLEPDHPDRRRRRPQGHARARRRHREGGRPEEAAVPRPGTHLRLRGRRVRGGRRRPVQRGRRHRHSLRGPHRRPRHARDAVDDGGALRAGRRREGRADHRRSLLRRHARLLHRPRRSGGGASAARSAC